MYHPEPESRIRLRAAGSADVDMQVTGIAPMKYDTLARSGCCEGRYVVVQPIDTGGIVAALKAVTTNNHIGPGKGRRGANQGYKQSDHVR